MNLFKILLLSVLIIFLGCSKDPEVGPSGAKGDAGEKGEKGDEGSQGPAGTANVIYSPWMDFDWNAANDPTFRQMTINVPEITAEFLDEGGTVLVYFKASLSSDFMVLVQVPYLQGNRYLYSSIAIVPNATLPSVDFEKGIVVAYESLDGTTALDDLQDVSGGTNYDIRYVLIPGGVGASSSRFAEMSYDYESIKQRFNIAD